MENHEETKKGLRIFLMKIPSACNNSHMRYNVTVNNTGSLRGTFGCCLDKISTGPILPAFINTL